jgi:tetratricopeptide (TPR) repeat protein
MKLVPTLLTVLLGLVLIVPESEARGNGRGDGGRSKSSASKRGSSGSAKRSPMTHSKIERPKAKPQPRPASRPDSKPASRPAVRPEAKPAQRPSVQKPATRPDNRPGDNKPNINRPGDKPGDNKPNVNRPGDKPGDNRPNINRPGDKPGDNRPNVNRPGDKPGDNRPNINRPGDKPGDNRPNINRPGDKPGDNRPDINRPDKRPSLERPDKNKPNTLPGMVTYPNRPDKGKPNRPNGGDKDRPNLTDRGRPDRNNVNIGDRNNKINTGDRNRNKVNIDNSRNRNKVHIDNVNVGRRNVGLNNPGNRPANRRDWDTNKWGGNKSVWGNRNNIGNNVNINIDNNFRYSNNFAYRPNAWGARPWWGASNCHGWHHGHWNYGYNSHYYHSHWYHDDDDFASGFMWGIGVWSLGNMIYNMGYQTYRNPYPAPPVQYQSSKSQITYTEPVSVTAAANPPGDDQTADIAETKSDEALERSRDAFKQGDYLAASKSVDEAIGYTPGDVSLHEYRALVFFTLGKYSDAAGVLNPVLASGPGWSWDTMIGFYNGSEAYNEQLRRLEAYVKAAPDKADARFLLGYHYMVCGYMDKSYEQFAKASELQPADSISRQLRDLTKSSIPDGGDSEAEPPAKPAPVPADQLVGTWVSDRGADGKVTFTMTQDGNYTWAFMNGGQSTELKGTYGLNDKGLLVLTSDDSQMVSEVTLPGDKQMKFVLIGAPEGDPGLEFIRN